MSIFLGAVKATKPRGTIISLDKARELAYNWHGGQWSPLYSFASSYKSNQGMSFNWDSVIAEVEGNLGGGFNVSPKHVKELKSLLKFFQYKRWESLNK